MSIQVDQHTVARGTLDKDSSFVGTAKFYSKATGRLVSERNFHDGKLWGDRLDYSDGRLNAKLRYENGLLNGWTVLYDNNENIESQQYHYYDLKVGPSISYKEGQINQYNFYSFENELLVKLNYDSLKFENILNVQKDYFFYSSNRYINVDDPNQNRVMIDYFLYMPSPPRFHFSYSLVNIDRFKKILSTEQTFDSQFPFTKFAIAETDSLKAIQLSIIDSVNNNKYTLLKVIS